MAAKPQGKSGDRRNVIRFFQPVPGKKLENVPSVPGFSVRDQTDGADAAVDVDVDLHL